jgi:hypothetical protein
MNDSVESIKRKPTENRGKKTETDVGFKKTDKNQIPTKKTIFSVFQFSKQVGTF